MMVFLAEKPDVATSIAASMGDVVLPGGEILRTEHLTNPKYESKIKQARKDGYFKGNGRIYTYAYGHLYTLKEPDEVDPNLKAWKMDTLPFILKDIPLKKGKEQYQRKQLDVLKQLLNDKSTTKIIIATDADREGEHIARTIMKMLGCKKPFERMWIKDMTESGLLDAYNHLRPGHEYDGLADAAVCRAESDYLVGMNMTRAMTLKFGGFKNVLSIGRVQTPTLAILVQREKEILNFVPEDYYTIKAIFEHANGEYEGTWFRGDDDRFKNKQDAETVMKAIKGKNGVLTEVTVDTEREGNPLLFNLSELTKAMNNMAGWTGQKTLQIAQALYEKHKLTTYPRTSSRYLAPGKAGVVDGVLKNLASAFPQIVKKPISSGWSMNKRFFDASKTTSHEAIIPTAKAPDLSRLNSDERLCYEVIVKRFVAAYYPPCVWEVTKATTTVANETFASSGKALKQAGWREVEGVPNANLLPVLKQGDSVKKTSEKLDAKKTQPPKRYTDADLRTAMEKAGRFVEDDELRDVLQGVGIGTEATRGAIVEELVKRGYVTRDKKVLVPTEKGMGVIDTLPVDVLKQPEMTAMWEQKLADVEAGKMSKTAFLDEMGQEIHRMFAQVAGATGAKVAATSTPVKTTASRSRAGASKSPKGTSKTMGASKGVIAKCPKCGGDIVEQDKGYSCSGWRQGCKVTIWKNAVERLGKKKITATEAKQLFTKGKTSKKVKLHSAAKGKDYEAYLTLDQNFKVGTVF